MEWRFRAGLRVRGRRLETCGEGVEVHAASYLRRREVVLDAELLKDEGELARVAAHELFHFAWLRMGNGWRREWEELLKREGTRRELGWSSEWRRNALGEGDAGMRSRRWREYVSESFCDTGAWVVTGEPEHAEARLGERWRRPRRAFFERLSGYWNGVWRI